MKIAVNKLTYVDSRDCMNACARLYANVYTQMERSTTEIGSITNGKAKALIVDELLP